MDCYKRRTKNGIFVFYRSVVHCTSVPVEDNCMEVFIVYLCWILLNREADSDSVNIKGCVPARDECVKFEIRIHLNVIVMALERSTKALDWGIDFPDFPYFS